MGCLSKLIVRGTRLYIIIFDNDMTPSTMEVENFLKAFILWPIRYFGPQNFTVTTNTIYPPEEYVVQNSRVTGMLHGVRFLTSVFNLLSNFWYKASLFKTDCSFQFIGGKDGQFEINWHIGIMVRVLARRPRFNPRSKSYQRLRNGNWYLLV